MKKGYLFISNSSKPNRSVPSTKEIDIDNFSHAAVYAANELGYRIFMGYNVDHPENLKCRQYDITYFHSNIYRNIFAIRDNYKAYRILCKLLNDHPEIEVIHCNTPIGGVVGRLAGLRFKKKVIYTAHGFHFYKGAPFFNRTILKWIEKWLAHYTDILFTINHEDYLAASNFRLRAGGRIEHIPGVGIDLSKYDNMYIHQRITKRSELGLSNEDILLISMGDLVARKNYELAFKIISRIDCKIHYLICGEGPKKENLIKLANELGISNQIHFLGFRTDIIPLLYASDIFILTSKQEGLPRSTMEAMAAGLPCVVSDIRGNRDLIDDWKGGYIVKATDPQSFAEVIDELVKNTELRKKMGEWNKKKIKDFDVNIVQQKILEIFSEKFR